MKEEIKKAYDPETAFGNCKLLEKIKKEEEKKKQIEEALENGITGTLEQSNVYRLEFKCPHCGVYNEIADEVGEDFVCDYEGETQVCRGCGKSTLVNDFDA